MNVKKVALLVGALVIAVVTAVMAKNMFTGAGAPSAAAAQAVPTGPKILVARKALPVGTIVDQESLAFQAWPKELVQNAYYQEGTPEADMSKLLGTVVRNPITAGQPVTRGALVGPRIAASSPRRLARACAPSRSPCPTRLASPASSSRATGSIWSSPRMSPVAAMALR